MASKESLATVTALGEQTCVSATAISDICGKEAAALVLACEWMSMAGVSIRLGTEEGAAESDVIAEGVCGSASRYRTGEGGCGICWVASRGVMGTDS